MQDDAPDVSRDYFFESLIEQVYGFGFMQNEVLNYRLGPVDNILLCVRAEYGEKCTVSGYAYKQVFVLAW